MNFTVIMAIIFHMICLEVWWRGGGGTKPPWASLEKLKFFDFIKISVGFSLKKPAKGRFYI